MRSAARDRDSYQGTPFRRAVYEIRTAIYGMAGSHALIRSSQGSCANPVESGN